MIGQRGFTLLEMLAALAVLAVCASVLVGAFGQSARALQQTRHADRLSLAARSVMDDLGEGPLQPGHSQGVWDGVRWGLDVTPQPSQSGALRLFKLDLSVEAHGRAQRFTTLSVRQAGLTP